APGQVSQPPQRSALPGTACRSANMVASPHLRANFVPAKPRAGGLRRAIRQGACDGRLGGRRASARFVL
ncbi:MAG: hypothetical protein ABIR26_08265, partial [Ramlibacter sp.]